MKLNWELKWKDSKLCLPEHLLERKKALSCWTILQSMTTNVHERREFTPYLTPSLNPI
jgi:hypothetical protein